MAKREKCAVVDQMYGTSSRHWHPSHRGRLQPQPALRPLPADPRTGRDHVTARRSSSAGPLTGIARPVCPPPAPGWPASGRHGCRSRVPRVGEGPERCAAYGLGPGPETVRSETGRSPRTGTRYSRRRWSVWWRSAGRRCATARLSQTAMSPGSRRCRTVQACPRPVRGSSSGRRRRRTAALCGVCSPNDRPPSGIRRAAKWSPMLFGDAGPARTGRVPDRRARC